MDPAIVKHFFEITNDESESSDTDPETVMLEVVGYTVADAVTRKEKGKIIRVSNIVQEAENCSEKEFQEDFRMTREAFNWLLSQIENKLINIGVGPSTILPKKQLLATIWVLATPDSYRSVGKTFGMPRSTLFKCVRRVVAQLTSLAPQLICWPSREERESINRQTVHWGNIPRVVGAIDGTFVLIKAPSENPQAYNNRKCFHSITLQAICDNKRRFRDIFTGYPSSVGDARIFRNSDFFKTAVRNMPDFFSENEFILGDKAYPPLRWCIPPYIDRGNLQRRERNFNTQHARTRQIIERAFALLFGRFRRLKYLEMSRVDLIPDVILACCVLHNICLMFPDEMLQNYEVKGQAFVIGDEEHDNVGEEMDAIRREGLRLRDEIAQDLLN